MSEIFNTNSPILYTGPGILVVVIMAENPSPPSSTSYSMSALPGELVGDKLSLGCVMKILPVEKKYETSININS